MNTETIKQAIEKYGTPLYIFFEDEFKKNYIELKTAYQQYYSNFQIAYSFKTNYMPYACKMALKLDSYAEVVSDLEYHMAKRYGFKPERIIVNGPGKWNGLKEMLIDNAIVMLDNIYEAEKVRDIAIKLDHQVRIGFRLNFFPGTKKESRFGFEANSETTKDTIEKMRRTKNVKIIGLHFHLGGARSIEAWEERAKKMISYADELLDEDEKEIIDLGSGMFGHLHPQLAVQFGQKIPSFDEYATVVAQRFANRYSNLQKQPMLVVEPGSTIIANTMVYATRIIAEKNIRGRNIMIVDGSVQQLGELGKKKQLPATVIHNHFSTRKITNADITGYTCLEDDVLYKGFANECSVGDVICIENAGAYTNVMKPPFIQTGCGIVASGEKSSIKMIKRPETIDDLLSSYIEGEEPC